MLSDATAVLRDLRSTAPIHIHSPKEPYFPHRTVSLYFYRLGNLVVTFGRGELIVAQGGVQALKQDLITLMLAESGVHKSDGQKRLHPYLTTEQQRVLESIPGADVEMRTIARAAQTITVEFMSRGLALARSTECEWPDSLVTATLDHPRPSSGRPI